MRVYQIIRAEGLGNYIVSITIGEAKLYAWYVETYPRTGSSGAQYVSYVGPPVVKDYNSPGSSEPVPVVVAGRPWVLGTYNPELGIWTVRGTPYYMTPSLEL